MTPHDFVDKWQSTALKERAAAQEHFLDLCALAGHPTPAQDDPTGQRFAFEAGATKQAGGQGWADVWKKVTSLGSTKVNMLTWTRHTGNYSNIGNRLRTHRC